MPGSEETTTPQREATAGSAAGTGDHDVETGEVVPADPITQLTAYLRANREVRHLVSELEIEDLTVSPWCNGIYIAAFTLSGALNAYTVQVYIKPTNEQYADNEFRWAFLGASLLYNHTLMTYFGSQPFIAFFRLITAAPEERAAILSSPAIWAQEISEILLASIAAVMMVDVAKQDGFSSPLSQAAIGSAFMLLTKSGARELINDLIKPLLDQIAIRAMLLQPSFFGDIENTWRRNYILRKEQQRFVSGLQKLVDAAIERIRTHRSTLTTTRAYITLAEQLTNPRISLHVKQALLLKALFELPVAEPEATHWGRLVAGLLTTITALTVTLSSQIGLYRNALERGGIGAVTGAVNACMSLFMAKTLGNLIKNLNATPASLATRCKAIGMTIAALLVFAGGLLTGGTTAREIAIYYEGKVPDGLFSYLEASAFGGSGFFNGYGLICMIAAVVVVNDLIRRTNFTDDPSHLEAVLIANLENLKRLFAEAAPEELIATLLQLHRDRHINLNLERLRRFFDLREFPRGTRPSEALDLLHRGGDVFAAGLSSTHSYRVEVRWFEFIVNDILLRGGIIGARYAAMALLPTPAGSILRTVEAYAASGAAAGAHKAAEKIEASCCRRKGRVMTTSSAGLLERVDPTEDHTGIDDDEVEGSCCSTRGICAALSDGLSVIASAAAPIIAGTAVEISTRYAAMTFFDSDPESAGNAAQIIGAFAAAATTYIPRLMPKWS